jgi:small-conductance mechanosensitive channel
MPRKAKPTQSEYQQYLIEIGKKILQGCSRQEILKYTKDKWNLSIARTDSYISTIRRMWKEEFEAQQKDILIWHVQLRRRLLSQALQAEDWALALEIAKDLAKIEGVYDPRLSETQQKIEIQIFYPEKERGSDQCKSK